MCIHTYIHIYMHTYIHAYIHTYIHTYIYTCVIWDHHTTSFPFPPDLLVLSTWQLFASPWCCCTIHKHRCPVRTYPKSRLAAVFLSCSQQQKCEMASLYRVNHRAKVCVCVCMYVCMYVCVCVLACERNRSLHVVCRSVIEELHRGGLSPPAPSSHDEKKNYCIVVDNEDLEGIRGMRVACSGYSLVETVSLSYCSVCSTI